MLLVEFLIIGFLFGIIGVPILISLNEIISILAELIKAQISLKIVECNTKMSEINQDAKDTNTRVIGFATTFDEEEEEEDYG